MTPKAFAVLAGAMTCLMLGVSPALAAGNTYTGATTVNQGLAVSSSPGGSGQAGAALTVSKRLDKASPNLIAGVGNSGSGPAGVAASITAAECLKQGGTVLTLPGGLQTCHFADGRQGRGIVVDRGDGGH